LSAPIYRELKRMIMDGDLKPGEKIIQEKVAEQLGVSRTPMTKALQLLENEMLVESIPRRGFYVKVLNLKELIDVYDCREVLEGMAAGRLAEILTPDDAIKLDGCFKGYDLKDHIDPSAYFRSDELFHRLLIEMAGNVALNKIYFLGNIYGEVMKQGLLRPPQETLQEHWDIIQAIRNGDKAEAEKTARLHIARSKQVLINQIKTVDK